MTRARPRKFAQSFTAKATTTDQDQVLPARGRLFSRYYLPACYQIYRQWHRMGPAGHGWAAAWHPHCLRSLAQINCHPTWSNPDILEDEVWADPKRRVLAGWAERAGLHHPISAFPGPTWGCWEGFIRRLGPSRSSRNHHPSTTCARGDWHGVTAQSWLPVLARQGNLPMRSWNTNSSFPPSLTEAKSLLRSLLRTK